MNSRTNAYVDAVAWIALLNSNDSLHETAKGIFTEKNAAYARLYTSEFVLLEVVDALAAPSFRAATFTFVDNLYRKPDLTIVPLASDLFRAGLDLYQRRLDKYWSLTDCISFEIMREYGLTEAFTSDKHFRQAGFTTLMAAEG